MMQQVCQSREIISATPYLLKNRDVVGNCYKRISQKFINPAPIITTSRAIRISNIVRNSIGGKTHFGNYYKVQPVFNYLGKIEGQPGGSGAPIRNRY